MADLLVSGRGSHDERFLRLASGAGELRDGVWPISQERPQRHERKEGVFGGFEGGEGGEGGED